MFAGGKTGPSACKKADDDHDGGVLYRRNVAGASDVLNEGYVTYSNEAKQRLVHVKAETLERFGAVSEETAREMAAGAAKAAGSDVAISATGIAGPGGGTKETPVGTVFMGCCYKGKAIAKEFHFTGNRMRIREQTTAHALAMLRDCIIMSR